MPRAKSVKKFVSKKRSSTFCKLCDVAANSAVSAIEGFRLSGVSATAHFSFKLLWKTLLLSSLFYVFLFFVQFIHRAAELRPRHRAWLVKTFHFFYQV